MSDTLQQAAWQVLLETDPQRKCELGLQVAEQWQRGQLALTHTEAEPLPVPGRPPLPELVSPHKVPKRSIKSEQGRVALLHAVTHIEFNAINLAWDAVYRFANMPREYYSDWISVALDEARHFEMLQGYLKNHGVAYGDFTAHNGLWQMAVKTDHDVLVRMALVPRVLEARGLDVTPDMMDKLREVEDTEAVAHLEIILREEINHVRIGSRWYHYCCEQRGLDRIATFRQLIQEYMKGLPKGRLNIEARLLAGFEADELEYLEELQ